MSYLLKTLHFLAQTKIFVLLLSWLIVLLVVGTYIQKDIGLYAAQSKYFSSFIWWIFNIVPLPGGYTIMSLIFIGLLTKTTSEKWYKKNIGTLITHIAVLTLFLGSFITSIFSYEGNMLIEEGNESQFINDYHKTELAVIEVLPNNMERVISIPQSLLADNKHVQYKNLPFDIKIQKHYANSLIEKYVEPLTENNLHYSSKSYKATKLPILKEQEMNQFALVINIDDLEYTLFEDMPLKPIIQKNGGIFRLELRKKRTYLPFKVELQKFKVERYAGTNKAEKYESHVVLKDGTSAWPSVISMNEPLRYKGYTFFQSSFIEGSSNTTVLAVVNNVGRLFPYISSIILCIGLLVHLFMKLPKLIRKSSIMAFFYLLLFNPHAQAFVDNSKFQNIPILEDGRIKPLDTFARQQLVTFNGKQKIDNLSASSWLAELLFDQSNAYTRPLFNISNPNVVHALKLKIRKEHYYSFQEVVMATKKHLHIIKPIEKIEKTKRTLEQEQLLSLYYNTVTYYEISRSFSLLPKDKYSLTLRIIPAEWGNNRSWYSPQGLMAAGQGSPRSAEFLKGWAELKKSYLKRDKEQFNNISSNIINISLSLSRHQFEKTKISLETFYNKYKPFTLSLSAYIAAFIVLLFSSIVYQNFLRKLSMLIMITGGISHSIGILSRMYIMNRPPVATLYESVLFVSLIAVIFAFILEKRRRDGTGLIIGTLLGSILQVIAMRYEAEGDTMGMLEAVLNTNFWLATHVVTITIGYGCCLVAGLIGHIYLIKRYLTPEKKSILNNLSKSMLGASFVALFFSVLGTILGGIWADQSWGRFWGWDPKENGAMLICMWLILLLHGRISGMLKPLYFAAGIAFTNVTVAIAWFGVNLLGVGLHSYGFTQNILLTLIAFCVGELLLIAALTYLNKQHKEV